MPVATRSAERFGVRCGEHRTSGRGNSHRLFLGDECAIPGRAGRPSVRHLVEPLQQHDQHGSRTGRPSGHTSFRNEALDWKWVLLEIMTACAWHGSRTPRLCGHQDGMREPGWGCTYLNISHSGLSIMSMHGPLRASIMSISRDWALVKPADGSCPQAWSTRWAP